MSNTTEQKTKAIIDFIGDKVIYDEFGGTHLWGKKDNEEGMHKIAEIRGWGTIQNLFSTYKEAEDFHDDLGRFIAEAITEKIQREQQNK